MDGEIMRKVSFMNYVIVAIIFIITIVGIFTLRKLYLDKDEDVNTNGRLNILSELKEDDLKSYLVENTEIVIYISNAKDATLETFENSLNDYIVEHELEKEIVYLNLEEVSSNFYTDLKTKYAKENVNITSTEPNMMIVENGKITKVLYEKPTAITIEDVDNFLKKNDVIE
jgi:hypothetical protein